MGEVLTAVRLLERLREIYPARQLYVSATTLAGRALAEEKLAGLVDGIFYAPIDYCFAVRRVLRTLRPSVVVVMETEIWPNWYREIKRTGAGLVVVNGRISDKAIGSYRRQRWFFRNVLEWPDLILAQSKLSARRYVEMGAPPDRVRNAGNLKYDFDPSKVKPPETVENVVRRLGASPVWISASTMPPAETGDVDEDDVVVAAFRELAREFPSLLLLLAPRRPARFDEVAGKLEAAGIPFLRRTTMTGEEQLPLPGVLLLDTIGELSGCFTLADAVFMGGTLARRGGHNILEPAFFSRPVIIGPHMENFPEIAAEFLESGGVIRVETPRELAGAVARILRDPEQRRKIGKRARELAEAERGATERAVAEIRRLSAVSVLKPVHPAPVRFLLRPFSWLWELGSAWKRARAMRRRRALAAPVISVGGIGMGGAGKTPFTLWLVERLKNEGLSPAILTRGYRRRVPEKSTILEAGSQAKTELTGDEAQLFLRAGLAHVGIGSDRYSTGKLLERKFPVNVMVLDDGFQHWQLDRQLDIVLIDALDPFAGSALFPLGRLREPLEALERADVFLITRTDPASPIEGIEQRLRCYNARAPIFRSQVRPLSWTDASSGETWQPEFVADRRVAAFCGLANPASFWHTLAALGCRPVVHWSLCDHCHYRPTELRRMAAHAVSAGAELLLTTEKDLMNLPAGAAELVAPLRLLWLKIGMQVENETAILDLIRHKLDTGSRPG